VCAQGKLTQVATLRNARIKNKCPKNVFAVTFVALIIGHDWARLLQPLAQSLTGSPGILLGGCSRASEIMMHDLVIIIYSPQKLKGENSIVAKLSDDIAEFGNTDSWFRCGHKYSLSTATIF